MAASHSSGSSSGGDDEDNWDDWTEEQQATASLFDNSTFPSAQQALDHDKQTHKVDLVLLAATLGELAMKLVAVQEHVLTPSYLGPDFFERIRLINWIRATVRTSGSCTMFDQLKLTSNTSQLETCAWHSCPS